MSSIVNKVKDVLHKDEDKSTTTEPKHSGSHAEPRTTGTTHGAGTGAGTTPSSHDGSYTTSHNYALGGDNRGTDGPASKTDGPHKSNLMNKLDPRVDSDRDHSKNMGLNPQGSATTTGGHAGAGQSGAGTTGSATRTEGPHSSNLANKADPRVDSDRDGSRSLGAAGHSGVHTGAGPTGTTAGTTGPATRTEGPHSSNLANKADPRVDSDRDGSHNLGAAHSGAHTGTTGTTGLASRTEGPHSSNLMNKADPRVDSDRDGSRNLGAAHSGVHTGAGPTGTTTGMTTREDPAYTGHGHGTTGTAIGTGATAAGHHHTGHGALGTTDASARGAPEGTYGPHSSRVANAADPRVDSDRDNSRTVGGAHSGTHTTGTHTTGTHEPGSTRHTAGPHQSDLANKLDPRVDSDRDGSKRLGGDKTDTRASRSQAERDSSDAAQGLPSVHSDAVQSRVPPEQHCGL